MFSALQTLALQGVGALAFLIAASASATNSSAGLLSGSIGVNTSHDIAIKVFNGYWP